MDPVRVEEDREAATSFYETFPLLFDGTRRTVPLAAWLYDMESIFSTSHIQARLQVSLASRCLRGDARTWWMTLGEPALPERTWGHFRTLVIARYGPIPDVGADAPYRDPEIYQDMHFERYYHFIEDWRAYPAESMGHYCRRFQEAMLPHVPQDLPSPGMQALLVLRHGLPPPIRQYVPAPTPDMTMGHMIEYILGAEAIVHAMQAGPVEPEAPADDIGEPEPVYEPEPAYEPEPVYEPGPVDPEDPMAADPEHEVPAQEAEADDEATDDDMDALDDLPEDPPLIVISSDDEDHEHEPAFYGWPDEGDDFEEDPEELPLEDGEADSDVSAVTIIDLD
ncbi:hypothetical protein TIFTF001_041045 [Ficus carica]|uniref:Retrotransposon gag domain-containing protein n=1 Tax=Ficus carica TaxID=3494 RepID=A0AA88D5B4_FICCA|nr:hypothetical protein TIFTF001_041045 [Ficus carica]